MIPRAPTSKPGLRVGRHLVHAPQAALTCFEGTTAKRQRGGWHALRAREEAKPLLAKVDPTWHRTNRVRYQVDLGRIAGTTFEEEAARTRGRSTMTVPALSRREDARHPRRTPPQRASPGNLSLSITEEAARLSERALSMDPTSLPLVLVVVETQDLPWARYARTRE